MRIHILAFLILFSFKSYASGPYGLEWLSSKSDVFRKTGQGQLDQHSKYKPYAYNIPRLPIEKLHKDLGVQVVYFNDDGQLIRIYQYLSWDYDFSYIAKSMIDVATKLSAIYSEPTRGFTGFMSARAASTFSIDDYENVIWFLEWETGDSIVDLQIVRSYSNRTKEPFYYLELKDVHKDYASIFKN